MLPIQVERAALTHAFGVPEGDLAQIPAEARPGTIGAVAKSLGVRPSEVRTILEVHWLETTGRAGAFALNGQRRSAPKVSPTRGGFDPLSIQIMGLCDNDGPTHNAGSVHAQFAGEAATEVKWDQPLDFDTDRSRKNRELDGALPKGKVGEYATVPLSKIADDDPLLQMRVYRGIGGRDPAQVALRMTGHLVPEGTSSAYDRFKTYDHRDPLDAYEWTLDPFVAAKSAGGRGTLMSMTLGELKAQGAEVFRKRGDTEGGIFVASVVAPEHRIVANEGDRYRLSGRSGTTRTPQQREAGHKLRGALERFGSWEGLLDARPKLAERMQQTRATETERLVRHWLTRLDRDHPGDPVAAGVQAQLEKVPTDDVQARLQALEKLLQRTSMRVSDLLDEALEPRIALDLS